MNPNDYPKVLVGVVTYEGKDYIFPQNYNIITRLDYPNYDFIIVDNSVGNSYISKLRRRGVRNVHRVPRGHNSREALSNSQNYIRNKFLEGNYDYLMFIESDLLPPTNIIQKLMKHQKPVTGVIYYIGTEGITVPCIFFPFKREDGLMGTRLISTMPQLDGKVSYDGGEEAKRFHNTGLQKVHGCGFGCTLLRRDVIVDNVFWCDERFTNKHSDVYFYMKLSHKGIPVYVDTNIVVVHKPSKWDNVKDR